MPDAFAILKVKVRCKSNWSPETTIAQVTRQARDDAIGQLTHALFERPDISIVGKPEITAVHTGLTEDAE